MTLDDLKNKPLLINDNLKITGPAGLRGTSKVTITTPVITPTSSDSFTETFTLIPNAVVDGCASISAAPANLITVSASGTPNCHWLPWASGKVYLGRLDSRHTFFFTYTINGCGVMIGGSEAAPIVAHANADSDRLTASVVKASEAASKNPSKLAKISQNAGKEQAIIYDHCYGNLAAKLIQDDLMSGARLEMVTPQQYLIDAGAGFGAVFGIQTGGRWAFYGNWAKSTRKIWP